MLEVSEDADLPFNLFDSSPRLEAHPAGPALLPSPEALGIPRLDRNEPVGPEDPNESGLIMRLPPSNLIEEAPASRKDKQKVPLMASSGLGALGNLFDSSNPDGGKGSDPLLASSGAGAIGNLFDSSNPEGSKREAPLLASSGPGVLGNLFDSSNPDGGKGSDPLLASSGAGVIGNLFDSSNPNNNREAGENLLESSGLGISLFGSDPPGKDEESEESDDEDLRFGIFDSRSPPPPRRAPAAAAPVAAAPATAPKAEGKEADAKNLLKSSEPMGNLFDSDFCNAPGADAKKLLESSNPAGNLFASSFEDPPQSERAAPPRVEGAKGLLESSNPPGLFASGFEDPPGAEDMLRSSNPPGLFESGFEDPPDRAPALPLARLNSSEEMGLNLFGDSSPPPPRRQAAAARNAAAVEKEEKKREPTTWERISKFYNPAPLQTPGSDFCNICWVEEVQAAPAVMLECGHAYHLEVKRGTGLSRPRRVALFSTFFYFYFSASSASSDFAIYVN